MHRSAPGVVAAALFVAVLMLTGCAPRPQPGSLQPTLTMTDVGGAQVAMQDGIPVPTFEPQPRRKLSLDGRWRVDVRDLDHGLSLTDRGAAMDQLLAEAAGRQERAYDDGAWRTMTVPGSVNPPPAREIGAWYRRSFSVPAPWAGQALTLKLGSANYVADVWLNGQYLGYHEGGYTPFAFDITGIAEPGRVNVLAIRVDNPPWGTRNDMVPWGLADWWNYGGLTGSVWIEATDPVQVVRADVVPHLDGADVSVVVRRAEGEATDSEAPTSIRVEVLPATVTRENRTKPYARDLVPATARVIVADSIDLPPLDPGQATVLDTSFLLGGADTWSPALPALYVLHVSVVKGAGRVQALIGDQLWTTFGLRRVAVDTGTSSVLLNGEPVMFNGVGIHDEVLQPGDSEATTSGHLARDPQDLLATLGRARTEDASLIRTGHTPANPGLLTLADRLGFAVWEEIPLYHFTPLTFGIAMQRGIAAQMLREMDLRDMNHPSVLFHGLANESTGADERTAALSTLASIDRSMDGTRLLGQAAYGFSPDDPSQAPLDVAGYTFYYGVFYGTDAASDTAAALAQAHATWPEMPIIALEFGRWADDRSGPALQRRILEQTYPELQQRSDMRPDGYVAGAVWWTLDDFSTARPGIGIEHFGLFDAQGSPRPAAEAARTLFISAAGGGAAQGIAPEVRRARVAATAAGADLRLIGYLAYGLAVSIGILALALAVLLRRGGRATGGRPS